MSKHKTKLIWAGLVLAMGSFILSGCGGGGGGGGGGGSDGVRALSLNGVTLEFEGANLTFSTPTPNASSGSTEIGGIVYQRKSNEEIAFSPVDSSALDGIELSWPDDLGGNTRYEYTPIDGVTGRLLIYADSREGDTFLNNDGIASRFDVFTLTFTATGDVITAINAVAKVTVSSGQYVTEFTLTARIAALTANPRPLTAGWNGVNNGPGFIADPSFSGKVLTLQEDGTNTQIQYGTFFGTTSGTPGSSGARESGVVAITRTENAGLPGENVETYSANYSMTQPNGTEQVIMTITYTSGTTALPANETVTLIFRGGERLTTGTVGLGIDVRTGTYTTSTSTSGKFILDRR